MNQTAKPTPGPWKPAGRTGGWDGVDAADGTNICHLEFNNPANGQLIAAAPELLVALKDVHRIALAMSLSTGAGRGQRARLDAAKALIHRLEAA